VRSTNLLEWLNQEIKRQTRVIRVFPNEAACAAWLRAMPFAAQLTEGNANLQNFQDLIISISACPRLECRRQAKAAKTAARS
jgi:transposase-like protein